MLLRSACSVIVYRNVLFRSATQRRRHGHTEAHNLARTHTHACSQSTHIAMLFSPAWSERARSAKLYLGQPGNALVIIMKTNASAIRHVLFGAMLWEGASLCIRRKAPSRRDTGTHTRTHTYTRARTHLHVPLYNAVEWKTNRGAWLVPMIESFTYFWVWRPSQPFSTRLLAGRSSVSDGRCAGTARLAEAARFPLRLSVLLG